MDDDMNDNYLGIGHSLLNNIYNYDHKFWIEYDCPMVHVK